jgi:hypothetical protein
MPRGYCVVNSAVWTFGGNGVDVTILTARALGASVLSIATLNGHFHHGVEEDSYSPDALVLLAIVTDGNTVRVALEMGARTPP